MNLLLPPSTLANLENHPHSLRIKKLMLATVQGQWENDRDRLSGYSLEQLIQEIFYRYPSPERLRSGLMAIAASLNKKVEYLDLANAIFQELSPLYAREIPVESDPTEPTAPLPPVSSPEIQTAIALPSVPSSPMQTEIPLSSVSPSPAQPEIPAPVAPAPPQYWFDVRAEVIKYVNPLQAKILLFATLFHPFSFSQEDWHHLKSLSLDDLLVDVLTLCPTLDDLEARLNLSAQNTAQPEENVRIATVICQSLQPCYLREHNPTPLPQEIAAPEPWSSDSNEDLSCMSFIQPQSG